MFIAHATKFIQESRAVARNPRDAAAVLFGLKFAHNIQYKLLFKVIDFGIKRKRVCNFLFVINSNFCPILPRFTDVAGFLLRKATRPLFHPNFRVFPLN